MHLFSFNFDLLKFLTFYFTNFHFNRTLSYSRNIFTAKAILYKYGRLLLLSYIHYLEENAEEWKENAGKKNLQLNWMNPDITESCHQRRDLSRPIIHVHVQSAEGGGEL